MGFGGVELRPLFRHPGQALERLGAGAWALGGQGRTQHALGALELAETEEGTPQHAGDLGADAGVLDAVQPRGAAFEDVGCGRRRAQVDLGVGLGEQVGEEARGRLGAQRLGTRLLQRARQLPRLQRERGHEAGDHEHRGEAGGGDVGTPREPGAQAVAAAAAAQAQRPPQWPS